MNKPLVSVIIPVYNVEEYLKECVDSVLAQTYRNLEIFLVDDGSTDGSCSICDNYALTDDRVIVLHKSNGGASSARNLGLTKASGAFVYFMDSDDYIVNDAIERLVDCALSNQSDLVFFDAVSFDDVDKKESTDNYSHKHEYKTANGLTIMAELINNNEFHVSTPLFFISKKLLDDSALSFVEGIMYEDCIFSYKLFSVAKTVSYLPAYLYYRRYRLNSVMTANVTEKNYISAFKAYFEVERIYHSLPDAHLTDKYLSRVAFNVFNIYDKLSKSNKKSKSEAYQEFKQNLQINGFYNNRSLKARYYGKLPWIVERAFNKLF